MSKQTVSDIINYLSQYPSNMEVRFILEPDGKPNYWLSDYESDEERNVLLVDIGDEEC